jgi:hypothetical protein
MNSGMYDKIPSRGKRDFPDSMYNKIPSGIRKSIDNMLARGYTGEVALAVILSAHRPDAETIKLIVRYIYINSNE